MSKRNRERRQRAADALPPMNRIPVNLEGRMFEIVEYGVADWCPARDGKGPAEAVALHLKINLEGILFEIVMRLKTPTAVDTMIAALERHRNSVWPANNPNDA